MLPNNLEDVRQRVIDRLAALLESQTRTKTFGAGVVELIRSVHQDVLSELNAAVTAADDPAVGQQRDDH